MTDEAPEDTRRDPRPDPTLTHELMRRYVAGDAKAELELFEKQRGALVRRAGGDPRVKGLAPYTSAEDLVDEALLRALESGVFSASFDRQPGALGKLLGRILDGIVVDTYRRIGALKRGGGAQKSPDTEAIHNAPSAAPTPTSEVRRSDVLELCRRTLTEREWRIWYLTEVMELDSAKVAERVGGTAASVRSLLRRVRRKLLLRIADDGSVPRGDDKR